MKPSKLAQVVYFHDNMGSIPVQVIIAKALSQLYEQHLFPIIAFEYPYGELSYLPDVANNHFHPQKSHQALEILAKGGYEQSHVHLLQMFHQQELRDGRLELWGVEDEHIFQQYIQLREESFEIILASEEDQDNYQKISDSISSLRCQELKYLDQQMEELNKSRLNAVAANIRSLMEEKSISFLPLVMSYAHYCPLRQKLEELAIKVVSYDIEEPIENCAL